MGGSSSKKNSKEDDEALVFDTRKIFYDEYGNIIYDRNRPVKDVDAEVRRIMEIDHVENETGKIYYIMDTAWITAWLAHTIYNKDISPDPGPCRNLKLIKFDHDKDEWVVRSDISPATAKWRGDYRRVTEEAWMLFKELYPGSGPAITFEYGEAKEVEGKEGEAKEGEAKEHVDKNKLVPTNWKIIDPPLNPDKKPDRKKLLSSDMLPTFSFQKSVKGDTIKEISKQEPEVSTKESVDYGDSDSLLGTGIKADGSSSLVISSSAPKPAIINPNEDNRKYESLFFSEETV